MPERKRERIKGKEFYSGEQYTHLRQTVDELIGECFSTCLFYEIFLGFQRCIFPLSTDEPVFDVSINAVVEQKGFLLYQANL